MTLSWFPELIFLKFPADRRRLRLINEVRLFWVGADLLKLETSYVSVT